MFRKLKDQFSGNSKNKYIKPEDLAINTTYSFSWNPEDQPILQDGPNPFLEWWMRQYKVLKELKYCSVRLFCEFSSKGRFHFHGYIKIKSFRFYLKDVPVLNSYGSCEMDVINHPETWLSYIMKNQLFMQIYLRCELYGPFLREDYDSEITISTN